MKKYIKPMVELQSTTPQTFISLSFNLNDGITSDQLARPNDWTNIWGDDDFDED